MKSSALIDGNELPLLVEPSSAGEAGLEALRAWLDEDGPDPEVLADVRIAS